MPKIKNQLFQLLVVTLRGGERLYLQAREEADIHDRDLAAPHVQALVKLGDIRVVAESKPRTSTRRRRA